MLGKMMQEKYYCGLDIGSRTVKAGILKIKGAAEARLVGIYEQKTYGFQDNAISSVEDFAACINHTIEELTKKTGVKVKEVYLGLSGALVESRQTETVIPLIDRGNKVITQRDIKKVNDNARLLGLKIEEELLHDLPQRYNVDDVNPALNPLGLYGRKLGVSSLMVVVNGNNIRNVTKAVHKAGYHVVDVFLDSFAASQVILKDEDRKAGCVLVDIGARQTTVLIFLDGILRRLETLPMGGDQLTSHIAEQLHLPFELAEEIKIAYAVAFGQDRYREEEILVKREEAYFPIKRGAIDDAIRQDVEALVQEIKAVLARSEKTEGLKGGIVFIGGGSLLSGLIERIGQDLSVPAKLGQMTLPLRKNLSHTATFSSVVGLAHGGYKKSFRYSFAANGGQSWSQTISNRMRELYQEYF